MTIDKINRKAIEKGQGRSIFLTFDDGPHEIYTPKILDILDEFGVKATFFVVGKNAERYPQIVKRIFKKGHDIGNHTYSHPGSFLLKARIKKFIKREIAETDRVIENITGKRPILFRPTLAFWDISSRFFKYQAKKLGHLYIGWSFSTLDWTGNKFIIKKKYSQQQKNDGDIILLHDGSENTSMKRRWATVKILPEIIKDCRNNSIQLLPLTSSI